MVMCSQVFFLPLISQIAAEEAGNAEKPLGMTDRKSLLSLAKRIRKENFYILTFYSSKQPRRNCGPTPTPASKGQWGA